jgi:hypothetical protein
MLDRYDNLIKIKYHPYGEVGDLESNSACAYFLSIYSNKNKDTINKILIDYIAYCIDCTYGECYTDSDTDIKISEIKDIMYNIFEGMLTGEVINSWNLDTNTNVLYNNLINLVKDNTLQEVLDMSDIEDTGDIAYTQLNQLYTRLRVGGRYDNNNEDCLYVRISSVGYDWGNDIMNVVCKKFSKVKYITIERDSEACSINKTTHKVYSTRDYELINHMPMSTFINQEHIPILSSVSRTNNAFIKQLSEKDTSIVDMWIKKNDYLTENLKRVNKVENNYVTRVVD